MEDKFQVQVGQEARNLLESEAGSRCFKEMEEHLNRLVWECKTWEEYLRLCDQRKHLDVFRSILNAYMVRGQEMSEIMKALREGTFQHF